MILRIVAAQVLVIARPDENRSGAAQQPTAKRVYCKFPQKRWMRVQASSSALVAVA